MPDKGRYGRKAGGLNSIANLGVVLDPVCIGNVPSLRMEIDRAHTRSMPEQRVRLARVRAAAEGNKEVDITDLAGAIRIQGPAALVAGSVGSGQGRAM